MDGYLRQGFVQEDGLSTDLLSGGSVIIKGLIVCKGEILINVYKHLIQVSEGVENDPQVQTRHYAYNAFVAEKGNILRHDNSHEREGHSDWHHYHEFDWETGEETANSPIWCGEENWPTLSDFIDKVEGWYHAHRDLLPNPDGFVSDLARYESRQIEITETLL